MSWRRSFWGTIVVVGTLSALAALFRGQLPDFLWSAGITLGLPLIWSIVVDFGSPCA